MNAAVAWIKARSRWQLAAIAVFAGVLAWVLFHPEMRADHADVDLDVLAAVQKTGFAATHSVRRVRYEITRSAMGEKQELVRSVEVLPPAAGVSERRSRTYQRENQSSTIEQGLGLTVGPIDLVGYSRANVPFLSDLLPYHFWGKRRLVRFDAAVDNGFPRATGGTLRAAIMYRGHYATGESEGDYSGTLDCDVVSVHAASVVDASLPGEAARLTCNEKLAFGTRSYAALRRGWYVFERNLWLPESRNETIGSGEFTLTLDEQFRLRELR